ncbi:MAG: hypothetical protein A3G24_18135 [Betaproteobacteria bacterium RIFCSPLOWO2_12_FULL_62_13]|nr:MAG: hypothetical protein A3G24_18135 [Betaproteobacteria bacterium RIFCSPLOWO2_12_FULL_62_13]
MCAGRDRSLHRAFDLELCLRHDACGENPDLVFSLFSVLQGAGNFSMTWEAQRPAAGSGELPALWETASAGYKAQPTAGLADAAALLCIPDPVRASTCAYLRRFGHHYPLIAVSMDVAGQGADAEHDAHWARFFHAIHVKHPDALILVLNRLSDRSARPFSSYVRIIQDVGFGVVEALAVAQQVDVYIGGLDAYGAAAWAAGLTGVYAPGSKRELASEAPPAAVSDNQIWFTAGSIFEEGLVSLEALLQRRPMRRMYTVCAPGLLQADAHGFLKVWDRRDFVVVLNPVGAGTTVGASGLKHTAEIVAGIREACADAVICLFGVAGGGLPASLSAPSALWMTKDFGSSPQDYAMLARCADAYVGVLDDFGRLALDSGRPGVYAERGVADGDAGASAGTQCGAAHPGGPLQWVIGRLDLEYCSSCLRDLVQHAGPRQLGID